MHPGRAIVECPQHARQQIQIIVCCSALRLQPLSDHPVGYVGSALKAFGKKEIEQINISLSYFLCL